MNNPDLSEMLKGLEHLGSYPAQQVRVETLKAWLFDVFVEVHVQEFKYNNKVMSKWKVVKHLYDAVLIRVVTKDLL